MFNRIATCTLRRCSHASRRAMCDDAQRTSGTGDQARRGPYPLLTGERGINKVMLIGRVGRDPEVRGTENTVTIFPLATSQSYKMSDDTYKQYTDWHRIVIFKKVLGSLMAQKIGKGDRVYVSGSVHYQKFKYEDKIQNIPQIRADDVVILGKRSAQSAQQSTPIPDQPDAEAEHWVEDESEVSPR